ncbi:helix-turn-helix domain-containing protein [Enterococcus hirae]|uniref:helix-turn-helix domain-containing protein n=1 Tax=Enterococcus hirae TaxID=1354 RepID=UPI00255B2F1C|nr:helix-turn-helix transcriptional regulator [Enterococcus hirae]MDL4889140.1 helix-turn-helix transcriptional regulator [Enterococcus hirae]MDL4891801.1 helix-turn-helix transcriptional regulator [Enterococcus hirae]MDL4897936.1 helix-turn-helix transcriptional regulator [Enterococcus hirae]MDL4900546.1 helix-turn-helix transcriptional regulator [Enterococcus hirae]MDL4903158.1 helix-turn-helix transcriptional regulator [Enterococcus hirae]
MTIDLNRLKAERIAKGLTQGEMANLMGWKSRNPYAKRENGIVAIGADELFKMASILGYGPNELIIFLRKMFPIENRNQRRR